MAEANLIDKHFKKIVGSNGRELWLKIKRKDLEDFVMEYLMPTSVDTEEPTSSLPDIPGEPRVTTENPEGNTRLHYDNASGRWLMEVNATAELLNSITQRLRNTVINSVNIQEIQLAAGLERDIRRYVTEQLRQYIGEHELP